MQRDDENPPTFSGPCFSISSLNLFATSSRASSQVASWNTPSLFDKGRFYPVGAVNKIVAVSSLNAKIPFVDRSFIVRRYFYNFIVLLHSDRNCILFRSKSRWSSLFSSMRAPPAPALSVRERACWTSGNALSAEFAVFKGTGFLKGRVRH